MQSLCRPLGFFATESRDVGLQGGRLSIIHTEHSWHFFSPDDAQPRSTKLKPLLQPGHLRSRPQERVFARVVILRGRMLHRHRIQVDVFRT